MAIFDYRARSKEGQSMNGAVVAPSENVAYEILRDRGLTIVSLSGRKESKGMLKNPLQFFRRVKIKEQVIFSRQLAVMIGANVPIVRALKILVRQTENPNFKIVISDILDEVDGGAKLSSAMGRYPQVFNNFFVYMVRSGETTGKLDEVLEYLATEKEKDYELISKMRGALIYPAVLFSGVIVVGVGLTLFVLPQLLDVFASAGSTLPLPTRILIGFVHASQKFWYLGAIFVIGLVIAFSAFRKTPRGRRILDMLKIRTPIFGTIFSRLYLTRLSRSMATLLSAGVPISRSLEITSDVVDNVLYREIIQKTIKEVEDGNSITTVFVKSKYIPLMVSQMMSIGEQSGRMEQILEKVAQFYERELSNLVANLVTLLEPVVLLLMGGAVGFLVAAILLPIYNLSNAI